MPHASATEFGPSLGIGEFRTVLIGMGARQLALQFIDTPLNAGIGVGAGLFLFFFGIAARFIGFFGFFLFLFGLFGVLFGLVCRHLFRGRLFAALLFLGILARLVGIGAGLVGGVLTLANGIQALRHAVEMRQHLVELVAFGVFPGLVSAFSLFLVALSRRRLSSPCRRPSLPRSY